MSSNHADSPGDTKRCFVVMGFGTKSDYATGRKLDLDKSYRLLIKPVVEEKGVSCVRADEIKHSGSIDQVMYQELFTADVVIADLSTANPNALYELGIRHALRPRTTIVISENKLPYPFDLNHIVISSYTHLGDSIDYDEVLRFRKLLGDTLDAVLSQEKTDSPVYTYLNDLAPPSFRARVEKAQAKVEQAVQQAVEQVGQAIAEAKAVAPVGTSTTLATLMEQGEDAIKAGEFITARELFALAVRLYKDSAGGNLPVMHEDPYLLQRLALATYKAKQPDEISALNAAMELLVSRLGLDDSNDPETVGLGGAVEKRLFDRGQGAEHLERAIWCYRRGYHLRSDRYNGINLAYLMNVRTDSPLDPKDTDKIADLVYANRLRLEVLDLCEKELKEIAEGEQRASGTESCKLQEDQREHLAYEKFWCLATKAEAHFGLGEMADYERCRTDAQALNPAAWMWETFDQQITNLRGLLVKHGHLLDPPWSEG
jgi:MAP3K TRAFs-binding domain